MTDPCACRVAPSWELTPVRDLGMNARFGEVTISSCPVCGQYWLRVHYEDEAFTASGRWYLGAISAEQAAALEAAGAVATLERLEWYYYGGSYYGGRTGKTRGTVY